MESLKILQILIIFVFGILIGFLINSAVFNNIEMPRLNGFIINNENAPSDFIKENQIQVYKDKIVINIENASIGRYADTGSMKPGFDEKANGIRIVPESAEQISAGDIITFERDNVLIIHRVIEKGVDDEGVYFITKGDNNYLDDGKVRFKDIKYITVGMIW